MALKTDLNLSDKTIINKINLRNSFKKFFKANVKKKKYILTPQCNELDSEPTKLKIKDQEPNRFQTTQSPKEMTS